MKKELNKKIISICENADSATAAEKCGEYMDSVDREFDRHIENGMTELEAYRAMLGRIDEIKAEVERLQSAEQQEKTDKSIRQNAGKLRNVLGQTVGFIWLADALIILGALIFRGIHTLPYTLAMLPLAAAATVIAMAIADGNDPKKNFIGFTGGRIALTAVFIILSLAILFLYRIRRMIIPIIVILFLISILSKGDKAK